MNELMRRANGRRASDRLRQANLSRTLHALQDLGLRVETVTLDTLSDLTQSQLAELQETWATLPPERRRALATALVELAEDRIDVSFSAIFRWLLEDQDPQVRIQAIEGLWEDEDVRLVEPLLRLLQQDPEPAVRAAAATSLGRYLLLGELDRIDRALAAMVEQALLTAYRTTERHLQVRRRLLESLAYSEQSVVQDFIEQAYRNDDSEMRVSAIFAMGRNADLRWRPYVLTELRSSDPALRFEAIRASGELELSEAMPYLLEALAESDVELRDAAIWALGRIGGPEARRALQACCLSEDEDLREAAEEALAELDFLAGDEDLPAFIFPTQV